MPIQDRATRLTARVAPYRDAILTARAGGLTWGDIGRLLGIQSPDAVRQAVKSCQYKAEQIPLPPRTGHHETKGPREGNNHDTGADASEPVRAR